MPRRETDPLTGFNFLIESGGVIRAGFSECTGLTSETDPVEYREGNEGLTARKLPGLVKYGNVTLKSGVAIPDQDLFNWRMSVMSGDILRLDISILVLDELREEQVRYNLTAAWPAKWMGPELKANANEIAVETLELAHEGVTAA
jgi:phage tail-like protein